MSDVCLPDWRLREEPREGSERGEKKMMAGIKVTEQVYDYISTPQRGRWFDDDDWSTLKRQKVLLLLVLLLLHTVTDFNIWPTLLLPSSVTRRMAVVCSGGAKEEYNQARERLKRMGRRALFERKRERIMNNMREREKD